MDLDNAIVASMKPSELERANRQIEHGLGQRYEIYSTPHLNPTPEQQVILQQVQSPNPKPKYHYDEVRPLPIQDWNYGIYNLTYDGSAYRLTKSVKKSVFFGLFERTESVPVTTFTGRYAANRFMTWVDDSDLTADTKYYFHNAVVAHDNTYEQVRQTRSPLGESIQEINSSADFFTGIDPSGLVNSDFYGTAYDWQTNLDHLPDL